MMIVDDIKWMTHALELAEQAKNHGEVPIGAVIVRNNQLIAEGCNQPIQQCDPTAHAEMIALRAAGQQLQNYRLLETTLYVTLEPCLMCFGAMIHARVQRLVYGAHDSKFGAVTSILNSPMVQSFNHHILCEGGVMMSECSVLLKNFFQERR